MSCDDGIFEEWDSERGGVIDLEFYEDEAHTIPENLSGRTFSVVVFNPNDPTDVYATAIGDAVELLEIQSVEARIKASFPADEIDDEDNWDIATYIIDDITDPENPLKFHDGQVRRNIVASPVLPTP